MSVFRLVVFGYLRNPSGHRLKPSDAFEPSEELFGGFRFIFGNIRKTSGHFKITQLLKQGG